MIITRTPYRISFLGGGTDYPLWYQDHGGSVISTTIDKYCFITCRLLPKFFDHKFRIVYSKIEDTKEIKDILHPSVREVLFFKNVHYKNVCDSFNFPPFNQHITLLTEGSR